MGALNRPDQRIRRALSCLFAGLMAAVGTASAAADQPPLEYQVKAAFLLNFTKFVEWPAQDFTAPDSPISICVLGDAPVGSVLEQMVQGEQVDGRKLVMQRAPSDPAKSCQVLFVSKSDKEGTKLIGEMGRGVLTVGEDDDFLASGGMINFIIDNRRVRFDINQKAVENSSLKLSSKLFQVARKVEK
jgi:hypothetical protein